MPDLSSGIRDNRHRGSVAHDFLREKLVPGAHLSFVSAYFTIYAFQKLQKELESAAGMRFLFGEPSFVSSIDPERTDKRAFSLVHDKLSLAKQLEQKALARDCAAFFARDSVEIRSVKHPDFLHGKLYHVEVGGQVDAIIGSSNFTVRGLGMSEKTSNLELNLIVNDRRDLIDLKKWFKEVWDDSKNVVPVKEEVLAYLEQLWGENSPRDLYFKTLIHVLDNSLAAQNDTQIFGDVRVFTQSQIWTNLYSFQKDGVRAAINKIKMHNGCIVADSVGLGKTFEALGVIKYFELKGQKVLVLCPKRLRENWTLYVQNSTLNPFAADRFGYTVLSHTDLSRQSGRVGIEDLSTFNWGQFGLVVIDESHNFRNNARGRKRPDGTHVPSRYERLMDAVIKSGARTQVLLLSATPVNVDLKDLRNQIYLLSADDDGAFRESIGLGSVKDTLSLAQRGFSEWAADAKSRRRPAALYDKLPGGFFALLDALTIARSRRHIARHYSQTLDAIGHFPRRNDPESVYPDIDTEELFLSYERLDEEISRYQLALFKPSQYVKPEMRAKYANEAATTNFSQATRERYLVGMMKVNFLKRLESSIASFAISMGRTIEKIVTLETKIADFKRVSATNMALSFEEEDEDEDLELLDDLTVGKGLEYQLRDLDLDAWLKDLRADKQQLNSLLVQARAVTPERDAKLRDLKEVLRKRIQAAPLDKDGRPNRKAIVFTAFSDTADYLFDNLRDWARQELGIHIAKVTGGSNGTATTLGRSDFNEILTNFAPRSKTRVGGSTTEEIDLLLATDCISEGQNLQDCGFLVNYDIHWNPVRLIQRFGRIDRIGSRFESIQMVNFWPTDNLNKYINLKSRVESRMALADISATAEDNILGAPIKELVEDDLKYRDHQLIRLQKEVIDLEELEDVSLGDFSLEEFRLELLDYLDEDARRLHDLPLGMYAVVGASEKFPPGAVFCLRAKNPDSSLKPSHANPTAPYYLLYVRREGEGEDPTRSGPCIQLGFAQAKGVLSLLRELCAKQKNYDQALCQAFADATQDGKDMSLVDELVRCAVEACGQELQQKTLSNLTQRGGTLLSGGSKSQTSDFELVTWFVLA